MDWGSVVQLVIVGIISGSLYAVNAVSWGLIYSTTRIFHFSHALVFTVGAYAIVLLRMSLEMPLPLAFLLGVFPAIALGCLIQYFIYRPIIATGASQLGVFLAALGTGVVGEGLIILFLRPDARSLSGFPEKTILVGPISFTNLDILTVVASWVVITLLGLFLAKSRLGREINAFRSNSEMAEIIGIDSGKIFLIVFAIGSLMAAISAFFFTVKFAATPDMGFSPLLMAFMAVFFGGVKEIKTVALAAVVIGLIQSLSLLILPSSYLQVLFTCGILFVFLIFKPQGLVKGAEGIG